MDTVIPLNLNLISLAERIYCEREIIRRIYTILQSPQLERLEDGRVDQFRTLFIEHVGLLVAYRVHLQERNLAPATINRRLAALRSVVKLGRTLGLITWTLEVALNLTNGNTRSVKRFSRHRRLETLSVYDDNRSDLAGQVAILVDLGA
jgi:hypothetical protein